jgi:hypothetical protein
MTKMYLSHKNTASVTCQNAFALNKMIAALIHSDCFSVVDFFSCLLQLLKRESESLLAHGLKENTG